MSTSPIIRQITEAKSIPAKNILFPNSAELPGDYSSTPGGTLYSTTPGGTRIVYERAFLMNLRNSPISKTPPTAVIPQCLLKGAPNKTHPKMRSKNAKNLAEDNGEQFQIDI